MRISRVYNITFKKLEPYDGKLSSTVLRGGNNSNIILLPDVISRSQEAKDLGINMGEPFFKVKQLMRENDVAVFSSNYQLYGDISQRIMNSFKSFTPDVEVYSIDEAFLRLDRLEGTIDLFRYAEEICRRVEQLVGIPLSIGISHTKTLAKLANHLAKENKQKVYDLRDEELQDIVLSNLQVGKVWGVGNRIERKLLNLGILTVLDLKQANSKMIRSKFSVVTEKTVLELRGISCLDLETMQPRQNIMSSKSFSRDVCGLKELEEALATYVAKAAVKLRNQKSKAQGMYVFIRTNRFSKLDAAFMASRTKTFLSPTNDTREIIKIAKEALGEMYTPIYKYKKAGIILLNLIQEDQVQLNFFANAKEKDKSKILMTTIDYLNATFQKEMVFIASQGTKRPWQTKAEMRSKRFTTKWNEICIVN